MSKATTKKQSPAVLRNGHLFCTHCGASFNQQLPQPVTFVCAMMNAWDKAHRNCVPTWQQAFPPEYYNEYQKANWWMTGMNGERGMSSEVIWKVMMNKGKISPSDPIHHPHDPDDFRRCWLLLETVPEWKTRLDLLRHVSPVWNKLVDNWEKFTELLKEQMAGKQNNLYELMKEIGC